MQQKTKQMIGLLLVVGILIGVTGCSWRNVLASSAGEPVVGAVVGSFDDTWRTFVRKTMYQQADGKVKLDIWTAEGSQAKENEKIEQLLTRKVNALVINLVEPDAASAIADKAKQAKVPVIFFNREPKQEVISTAEDVYYVGAHAEQSGLLQGQILVQYFRQHPTADGTVRYVLLRGEPGHQDAELRSQYVLKALTDAGLRVQAVAEEAAMWDRLKAQGAMERILGNTAAFDCVIANNDDMALGAIDALKLKGYFNGGKYVPVVGVDATALAVKAVQDGTLLGTVLNDAVTQGNAIVALSEVLAAKKTPNKDNCGYELTNGKYIWVDYKIITKQNIQDAK